MIQVLSAYDDIGSSYDSSVVDRNTAVINSFAENHPNTEVYFMLCPTSIGIYGEKLLPSAVLNMSIDEKEMIDYCYGNLANVTGIDVYTTLADASDEYIYYRTDHHWTSLGAFKAYTAAADYLDYTPYALEDFDVESINNSFQGTLFSKTLDQSVTKDSIDLYTLKNAGFTLTETTSNGVTEESYDSIFFKEYLEVKDKYSTYTGSNVAVCTITKNGADAADADSSLLIIKDSYANSMIQFLANNYDCVTMIDMRYTNMPLSALVNVEDYNQVLFLYNCITFADDSDLMKINLGE
jgi:hypothetical protein